MSKINKNILLLALMACIVLPLAAQNTSPYSRYGYGVLRDQVSGPSKGMGGIGYGLRNNLGANTLNPASYSAVDSLTFLFDIGVDWRKSKLSDNVGSFSENDGGLNYVTMLLPVTKRLGVSFGLLPYSTVGYRYDNKETKEGVGYTSYYNGSGGLTQVYGGIGYLTPLKGLSVGANISYLYGKPKHDKNLKFDDVAINSSRQRTTLSISTMKLDIGAQYEFKPSENNRFVIGAMYSPRNNNKGSVTKDYYEFGQNNQTQHNSTKDKKIDAGFPDTYGLGFTYLRGEKLTLGADVTFQKWSSVKYTSLMSDAMEDDKRFNDRWKFGFGAEYRYGQYERNYFKLIRYRAGFNYSNSYLNYKYNDQSKGYNEYGVTVGLGLPFIESFYRTGRISYININLEYQRINPEVKGMIKEEYFGISLNMNINELWFRKRKLN